MADVVFAIPGDIALPTGGYAYDRRILALLPECGVRIRHLPLPGSFPSPDARDLATTERALMAVPPTQLLLIDGLAYGALPADLLRRIRAPIVALVHHPLCLEAGLPEVRQRQLRRTETDALALARHAVVTSRATAAVLTADFGVPPQAITVAEPGTDPADRARGSGGKSVQVLAVGSVVPRKGYDLLVEALAGLRTLDWQLTIVGALDRSPETTKALRAQISADRLPDRVTLAGAVDDARLEAFYDRADLFVMSSHYEGYGMVLAEALARGLAIVTTTGGGAGDAVPDSAALKVMPGSPRALMWVLGRALSEPDIRRALSDAAWAAASTLPRWRHTSEAIAAVLRKVGQ